MMTAIVARLAGLSVATSGPNIWISHSDGGALLASLLDGQPVDAARATSPNGEWIIVPQGARVDRALRELRGMLDGLIHDVHGNAPAREPEPAPVPAVVVDVREPFPEPVRAVVVDDSVAALADRIRAAWQGGASRRRLALVAGFPQYGGSYVRRIEDAIEYLQAEAATTPQSGPPARELESPSLPKPGVVAE